MKTFFNIFLLAVLLPLSVTLSIGATKYGILNNGDWVTAGTWSYSPGGISCGCIPSAGDHIIIPAGLTIYVNGPVSLLTGTTIVDIYGTLNFGNGGSNLALSSSSIVNLFTGGTITCGGSGNNNLISFGGVVAWNDASAITLSGPMKLSQTCNYTGNCLPLPVTFTYLKGDLSNDGVAIQWGTVQEINNDHFEIQRREDGGDFNTIGTVKGEDNSVTLKNYLFYDKSVLLEDVIYYRLKQIDKNNNFHYSDIISVQVKKSEESIKIFPNPAEVGSLLNIDITSPENNKSSTLLVIVDSHGNEIFHKLVESSANNLLLTIDVPTNFAPGIYYITASNHHIIYHKKIIINK